MHILKGMRQVCGTMLVLKNSANFQNQNETFISLLYGYSRANKILKKYLFQ